MVEQLDLLTLSAAVSPAKTSAPQDPAQDSTAPARACGSKCSESCERCGPLGSLLKTSLRFELEALTGCSTTWRRAVTPGGSSWWVLMTSARLNDANAPGESSDEWPTPTATPYGSSNNGSPGDGREAYATAGKPSLENLARAEWPTPTTQDARNHGGPAQFERHALPLNAAVSAWVTPTASLGNAGNRSRSGARKGELLLTGQALQEEWPTPTSNLGSNGARSTPRCSTNGPNLHEAAKHWPTPRAEDSEQTGAHRGVPDTLTSAARMWPTATAGDAKASGSRTAAGSNAHPGISLTDVAVHGLTIEDTAARVWATPSASESRHGYQRRPEGMASLQQQQSLTTEVLDESGQQPPVKGSTSGNACAPSRSLNANWVFQLMGYPATWARLSTVRDSRLQEIALSLPSPSASDECS